MFLYVYVFKLILFRVSVVTKALEVCLVAVGPNDVAVFLLKLDERAVKLFTSIDTYLFPDSIQKAESTRDTFDAI